jgi:PAS domain S-box-containing protein
VRIKISSKIILLFILLLVAFGVVLSNYFLKNQKKAMLSEFDIRVKALLGSLATSSEYPVLVGNRESLKKMGKGILQQKDVAFCEIIDKEGDILFRGGSKDGEHIREYTTPILTEKLRESTDESLILGFEEKEIEEIGRIRLALSLASLRNKLSVAKKTAEALIIASIIFAAVFITVLVRLILSRPIDQLMKGTERISRGDLSHKVPLKGKDEIGLLAGSFNKMTDDLERTTVSRDYLNNVIGSMTDSLIVASREGKINRVNQAILDLLGYEEEELVDQDLDILFLKEERSHIGESIKELITSGKLRGYKGHFRAKDGRAIPVLLAWSVMKDAVGNITNFVCMAKDITELKEAEQALRESEERYRTHFEETLDAIFIADMETGTLIDCNRAALKLVGRTKSELVGKHQQILHPKEELEGEFSKTFKMHSKEKEGQVLEASVITKNGEIREVSIKANIFELSGKKVLQGIFHDITEHKKAEGERKRLEARLQQAQKMEAIGTLAGGIAHDFNNILTAVIGYTELAMDSVPKESLVHDDLHEVLVAGMRARDLVKQILTFSRQTAHDLKPIQVKLIVKEVLKLLRATLPTTIDIRQDIQSDSIVMADPIHIHQILMNLCTNASQAIQEKGGILEVSLADIEIDARDADLLPGTYLKLTVSDTGEGMTSEVMGRIFEPYFTTKGKGEGTGMGLAVVHGIVKSCGGTIRVYSKPGNGSTFHVYLPVKKTKANAEVSVEVSLPTGTERILFIDDEQSVVNMGKQLLESLGYNVVTRTSSVEALEAFRVQSDSFDLVITDMTMPNMTGEKLAIEIMKVRPDIPVILCTGFSPVITEEKAKALGIRAFIMKPILRDKIAVKIRDVLDE